MDHDFPTTPPSGPPTGVPSQPAGPLPPPPASATGGPGTGSTAKVWLVAIVCLAAGLIVGGAAGVLLSRDDDSQVEATGFVDESEQPPPSAVSSTSTSTTVAPSRLGSRSDPFPLGASLEAALGIDVVIQSVDVNGDALVDAANMFNDPPSPGNRFVLVNVKITNTTDEPVIPWLTVDVEGIGSANQVRGRCGAVPPDSLTDAPEIYPGGQTSGNACVEVPIAEIEDGSFLLLVSVDFGDPVFVRP
jgi:hypothetical protein